MTDIVFLVNGHFPGPPQKRLNDLFKVMELVSVDGAHTQSQVLVLVIKGIENITNIF